MKIFLVRHGLAVEAEGALRDEFRYLSPRGRHGIRQVSRVLCQQGISFDAVLTSPLVRAVQTAELLAEGTGFVDVIEALPQLVPGVPPRLVAQELAARGVVVAVVGHEPGISALGALLTGRPSFPPLRPGQVDLIEDGAPRWLLHPEVLQVEPLLLA